MSRQVEQSRSAGSRRDGQGCRSRSRSRSHSSESSGLSSSPDLQERSYRRKYRKEDWPHDETRSVANPELGSRSKLQPKDFAEGYKNSRATNVAEKSTRFQMPSSKILPVKMSLAASKPPVDIKKKITVASAFNNDSTDEDEEEMPAECRMRMRNIGRDTPTSSGPNSFGKTKQGFCDSKKMFEKNLRDPNA